MSLSDQDFLRYSRQLLLQECGLDGQAKLQNSRVLVMGLGGLGSPVAQYLAGAGVGKLYLADFDQVELSNLARQFLYSCADMEQNKALAAKARLQAVNPQIEIVALAQKLDFDQLSQLVQQVDLVLDCCDNMPSRHQINRACMQHQIPLISGSAVGFSGQLLSLLPSADYGCYACLYPDETIPQLNCKTAGILAPVVATIGSLQALEALKYLLGLPLSSAGKLLLFDGKQLQWQSLNLSANPDCPICANKQG